MVSDPQEVIDKFKEVTVKEPADMVIKQKEPDQAALAMEEHMKTVLGRFG